MNAVAEPDPQRRIRRAEAPAARLLLLEPRAAWELGSLRFSSAWLNRVPKGDGHPVLVLPGFMASDASTAPLRRRLRDWGYYAHSWRQGRNLGPTDDVRAGMIDRLDSLYRQRGAKVTLIGWSLGGIYARELARLYPEKVRGVITLGSPYRMSQQDRSSVSALADQLMGRSDVTINWVEEDSRPPLEVPATSIYSRTDGIVRWHLCIDGTGPLKENVEVLGSHTGLGFNPSVLYVIGDRLALPEGQFRPFVAPPALRRLYPRPAVWNPSHRYA
jgi:pimeloyl-ACP methyl ester carboxylesterase